KELECERECSKGEDYRLIKLTITDFNVTKKERATVVECKGHDAARFHDIDHAHGWDKEITGMVEQKDGKKRVTVSFECETLKADSAAEDHIRKFMPKLAGMDAVGKSILEISSSLPFFIFLFYNSTIELGSNFLHPHFLKNLPWLRKRTSGFWTIAAVN
ncbi:HAT family dimerization domain containing protein, partial [Trifolium medium]|nr:HAT family dimerization domain containing protein [Trifolium medium]